jgi:hypothetical protein
VRPINALYIALVGYALTIHACSGDSRHNRAGDGGDAASTTSAGGKAGGSDTTLSSGGSLTAAGSAGATRTEAGGAAAGTSGSSGTVNNSDSAGPVIGGCAIFPSDNPWNTRVDDAAIFPPDPSSAAILQNISAHANTNSEHYLHADFGSDFGIPYTVVPASQPVVSITVTEASDESDRGAFPIPPDAPIESGSDTHVLVLQSGACLLFELFNAAPSASAWSCYSAAKFDLSTNAIRTISGVSCPTSADAAGLPIFSGLVKYEEVAAGRIAHAIRFTLRATRKAFVRPATHYASTATDAALPPMGMRVRLKKVPAPITGQARVVATALAQYGMILADNGSNWFISGAPDPRFDDDDLNQLKSIPETDFEVIAMGKVYTATDCP